MTGRLDVEASQEAMDRLLSQVPDDEAHVSVKDALEADRTLGGACRALAVQRADNLRAVTIGATDYLAVDVVVLVHS